MIILVIIGFIIIGFLEIPKLIKEKSWYDLGVFAFFYLIAFVLSVLHIYDVEIPNPADAITFVVRDVLHVDYK